MFYNTTQGGIRAVIWVDGFQAIIMLAGLLAIFIKVGLCYIESFQFNFTCDSVSTNYENCIVNNVTLCSIWCINCIEYHPLIWHIHVYLTVNDVYVLFYSKATITIGGVTSMWHINDHWDRISFWKYGFNYNKVATIYLKPHIHISLVHY